MILIIRRNEPRASNYTIITSLKKFISEETRRFAHHKTNHFIMLATKSLASQSYNKTNPQIKSQNLGTNMREIWRKWTKFLTIFFPVKKSRSIFGSVCNQEGSNIAVEGLLIYGLQLTAVSWRQNVRSWQMRGETQCSVLFNVVYCWAGQRGIEYFELFIY